MPFQQVTALVSNAKKPSDKSQIEKVKSVPDKTQKARNVEKGKGKKR